MCRTKKNFKKLLELFYLLSYSLASKTNCIFQFSTKFCNIQYEDNIGHFYYCKAQPKSQFSLAEIAIKSNSDQLIGSATNPGRLKLGIKGK